MLLGLTCERDGLPDSCTNVYATTAVVSYCEWKSICWIMWVYSYYR